MSKNRRRLDVGLVSDEVFQAIAEIAESERRSIADIARQALEEKFLYEPPEDTPGVPVLLVSEKQFKALDGKCVGVLRGDKPLPWFTPPKRKAAA